VKAAVAIPVLDGARWLDATLRAVRAQDVECDLVIADSGSTDGSRAIAQRHGARIVDVERFSHGGTRNLLMRSTDADVVAFLTQDAEPSHPGWLRALLDGFAAADDVALVLGREMPRPGAEPVAAGIVADWYARMAALARADGRRPDTGPDFFFTSVNGAVLRRAWSQVPFRDVPYAEDRALAADLLTAGWARAYAPDATVLHSHDYTTTQTFRRAFDEARALREIYGHVAPAHPRALAPDLRRGRVHAARALGAAFGARAERLPRRLRATLSLEGRH
jgi:rhamnosyltransferase